jgi:hypothetical protein
MANAFDEVFAEQAPVGGALGQPALPQGNAFDEVFATPAGDEAERNSVWDEAWRRVTTPFVAAKDALGQGVEMAADKIQQGAAAWGQGIGDMIYADSRDQLAPGLMRSLGGVVDMGVGIGRGAFAGVTPLFTFGLEAAKQVPGLDEKAEQVERWMAWPGNMYRQYLGDPDGLNPVPESQPLLRAGWDAFELGAEAAPFATGAEALPVAWRARPRFREIPADMAVLRRNRTESAPVSPVVEALPAVEKAAPVGDAEPLVPGPEVQRVVDDNWNAWVEPAEPSVSATADKSGQPSAVSKEPWQMPENGGRVELSGGGRLRDDISGTIWQVHNDGRVLDIVRDGDQPGMTVRVNVEDYTSAKFSPPDSGKGQIPIEGKPSAVATPRPALSVEEARAYLNRPGQIMGYPTESIMAKQQGEVPPSTSEPTSPPRRTSRAERRGETAKPVKSQELTPAVAERISAATVQPERGGKVFRGKTHADAYAAMLDEFPNIAPESVIAGFETSTGRIVNRSEAARISNLGKKPRLESEDLPTPTSAVVDPEVRGPEPQTVVDDNWNAPAPRLIKAAEPVKSQELTPAAPALLAKINAAFENGGWAGRSLSAQGERGALETATGVPFPYRPTESGYSRNQVSFTPEESRAISQMTDSDLVAAGILQRLPSGELTWTGATPKAEIATKPAAEVPTSRAERRGETEVGGGLPLKQAVENFTETDVDGLPNIYPAYKTPDGTQITYTLNHEPRIKANNPRYFDDAGFWFPFDNEQSKNALFDDAPSGALNGFPELLVEASASGKTGIFISIRELDAAGGDYKAALTKKLSELEAKPAPSRPKVETKEPWQMTKAEWLARDKGIWGELSAEGTGLSAVKKFHEVSVRDALREGKPVPPEVLAEYGLEAKPAAEVPPSTRDLPDVVVPGNRRVAWRRENGTWFKIKPKTGEVVQKITNKQTIAQLNQSAVMSERGKASARARRRAGIELPELVEFLQEHGGIMGKDEARRTGRMERLSGEYDDMPQIPLQFRQALFGNGKMTPDQAVQLLINNGRLPEGSKPSDLYRLLERDTAKHTSRAAREREADDRAMAELGVTPEEAAQYERFSQAVAKPSKTAEPVPVAQLKKGDKFRIKGEEFVVTDVSADGTVTVEDGRKFGIRELSEIDPQTNEPVIIPVDKGGVKSRRQRKGEDVSFDVGAMEGETVSNELMAELSAFDEARHGGLHPTPSQKLIDSGLIEKRRGQYRITDEARSNLIEWNKEQKRIKDDAAAAFDLEQEKIYQDIEAGRPIAKADLDKYISPDSPWRDRAIIAESKSKSKSKSTSDEGFTLESVTPEQLRAEQWKAKWDAAKKDNDAAWELHFNLQKMAAAETDPWRKAQLEQQRDEAYAQTQVHKRRLTELANENAGTQTELGAVTAPAERQVAEKLMQGGLKGEGDPVVDAARVLEDQAGGPNAVGAVAPALRQALASGQQDKVTVTRDQMQSVDPNVEARWQAARTPKVGLWQRLKEYAGEVKASFQGRYPELTKQDDAAVIDVLLRQEAAPSLGQARAVQAMEGFTAGFGPNKLELFSRVVILRDLAAAANTDLYAGVNELNFGYTRETLARDLARFEEMARQNPDVARAVERRQKFFDDIKREAVAADMLPASVLEQKDYFHRQVMQYLAAKTMDNSSTLAGRLAIKRRGWQQSRSGSAKDYNTDYLQAEYEVLSQMLTDIETRKNMERVRDLSDIGDRLKRQAKMQNLYTVYGGKEKYDRAMELRAEIKELQQSEDAKESIVRQQLAMGSSVRQQLAILHEERNAIDPLWPFVVRKAVARSIMGKEIYEGKVTGIPERLQAIAEQLSAEYESRRYKTEVDMPELGENDGGYIEFAKWLADSNQPSKTAGLSFFKALADERTFIRETAGDKFVQYLDLMPPGYATWQPDRGNRFYRGLTIADKTAEAVMNGERELTEGDLREQTILGGPKETWVVPERVANTLNNFTSRLEEGPIDRLARTVNNRWKQYKLLGPLRALKYNINNLSGDFDASVMASGHGRGILKELRGAEGDLRRYHLQEGPLTEELATMQRHRVMGSGISVQEIPGIGSTRRLRRMSNERVGPVRRYWEGIGKYTQYREDLLRVAAYRYFLKEIQAGRSPVAASDPVALSRITDPTEKAAKLSRDLLGDYGNISKSGEYLRSHVIPFYSWMEINAPRYVQLLKNAGIEQGTSRRGAQARVVGALAGKAALKTAGKTAVWGARAAGMYALVNLWNHVMFPDEERELAVKSDQLHLILGRNEDGTIRSVRFQGALSDVLGWVGLEDFPQDAMELAEGSKSWGDQAQEMATAPVNRLVNAAYPLLKTPAEAITGKSLYPNVTEPRSIRDPLGHVARALDVEMPYNYLTDKPSRGWQRNVESVATYTVDPGQLAYTRVQDLVSQWQKSKGRPTGVMSRSPRSDALYYYKKSLQYGDTGKADRWKAKYMELGGKEEGIEESVKRAHPISTIPAAEREEFLKSLARRDRQAVTDAEGWYNKVYQPQQYSTPEPISRFQRRQQTQRQQRRQRTQQ